MSKEGVPEVPPPGDSEGVKIEEVKVHPDNNPMEGNPFAGLDAKNIADARVKNESPKAADTPKVEVVSGASSIADKAKRVVPKPLPKRAPIEITVPTEKAADTVAAKKPEIKIEPKPEEKPEEKKPVVSGKPRKGKFEINLEDKKTELVNKLLQAAAKNDLKGGSSDFHPDRNLIGKERYKRGGLQKILEEQGILPTSSEQAPKAVEAPKQPVAKAEVKKPEPAPAPVEKPKVEAKPAEVLPVKPPEAAPAVEKAPAPARPRRVRRTPRPAVSTPEAMKDGNKTAEPVDKAPENAPTYKHPEKVTWRDRIKGSFGSVGRFMGRMTGKTFEPVGGYAKFQADRLKLYGSSVVSSMFLNRRMGHVGKLNTKYEIENEAVTRLEERLNNLNKAKSSGEAYTPRQMAKMEKESHSLRNKIVKAKEVRDKVSVKLKFVEGMAMSHENKKKLLASRFAEIVDARFKGKTEKYNNLEHRKENVKNDMTNLESFINSSVDDLEKIKAEAKNRPDLKGHYKQKIRDIERDLNHARQEFTERANNLIKFDRKLMRINKKLSKWEVKKDSYERFAAENVKETTLKNDPSTLRGYKSPESAIKRRNARTKTGTSAEDAATVPNTAENIPEVKADTDAQTTESSSSGASDTSGNAYGFKYKAKEGAPRSYEAKKEAQYSLENWIETWNGFFGSKLRLNRSSIEGSGLEAIFKSQGNKLSKAQFAAIIKETQRKVISSGGGVKAKIKDSDLDFVARQIQTKAMAASSAPKVSGNEELPKAA